MSSINNVTTEGVTSTPNSDGGLDIEGNPNVANRLNGSADGGDDDISGGGLGDVIDAGLGDDNVEGGGGDDILGSSFGDDTVDGGEGNDFGSGGAGGDTITGGDGIDILFGGNGDDIIDGGAETDYMVGGAGSDTFRVDVLQAAANNFGVDEILDFDPTQDSIELGSVSQADLNNVSYDANTGIVSLNGQDIVKIDAGLNQSDIDFGTF